MLPGSLDDGRHGEQTGTGGERGRDSREQEGELGSGRAGAGAGETIAMVIGRVVRRTQVTACPAGRSMGRSAEGQCNLPGIKKMAGALMKEMVGR